MDSLWPTEPLAYIVLPLLALYVGWLFVCQVVRDIERMKKGKL